MTDVRGLLVQVGPHGPHGPNAPHGPMGPGGGSWGAMPWGVGGGGVGLLPAFLWVLALVVVVAGLAYLLRRVAERTPTETDARAVLGTRYARGEIDHEEFERRRERLANEP